MKFRIAACTPALMILAACSSATTAGPASNGAALPMNSGQASAQYTVTELQPIGGGVAGGSSINNEGWASGFSSLTSSAYLHAALWQNGGAPTDLGTLGGPNSAVEWPVKNDNGLISGISETNAPQQLRRDLVVRGRFLSATAERTHLPRLRLAPRRDAAASDARRQQRIRGWRER